ncbi:MAG: hypothetical protein A2498_05030 [Lentisphaerae bacterium RIFOXYC12_FULL_60_16]|nr:MAG: hypothetical protein A2498_05030 [Lentisphaerae bacterium RIFOXYC12_FULL_60_16]OGV72669.1 MAG: hypothetical protein A2269_00645 [Lentisphaerae bacterium RIFOXYA12_FULL_60_10]OGV86140.1 MAG: hypothetical protein A2340_02470 [Lentisphaerae bacterium RIFOXYB12_FULL_60_10]
MLNVCVLGSGSTGNCIYIAASTHAILVDAGLSGRETERRLVEAGGSTAGIRAVFLTHEHEDHVATLGLLQRRHGIGVYANHDTAVAVEQNLGAGVVNWTVFGTGYRFELNGWQVDPFSVMHDAQDPVGFRIDTGEGRVAVVTDIGTPTALVRERLKGCEVVILECNHDLNLLHESKRPWSVKQRISGRHGHFSNQQASELMAEVAGPSLQVVYLAHLSDECNRPERAVRTMRTALDLAGFPQVAVELTYPDRVSRVWMMSPGGWEPVGTPASPG